MFYKLKNLLSTRLFDITVFSAILLIVLTVFLISDGLTQKKTALILNEKYNLYSQKVSNDIKSLIDSKNEMTLTIALSLAEETSIKNALITSDDSNLHLKNFSKKLSSYTSFKNVWFNLIDKNGIVLSRSWIDKKGDSVLKSRLDVNKMIKNPSIMSTISVGIFDMTFKSMVPIYHNKEFIGIFEIITHFNSIVKNLSVNNIGAIVLVDKKYKNQITKPFTKTFLEDYYIANKNANSKLLKYIKTKGIENFYNQKINYTIDEEFGKLITFYNLLDINKEPMATIIAFEDLSRINMDDVEAVKTNMTFYTVLFVIFLVVCGYYLVVRKYSKDLTKKVIDRTKELNNEKSYIQTIFDTNPSIIVVMKDLELIRVNKSFLDFFGYLSLENFAKEHKTICSFFVSINEYAFPTNKKIEGKLWSRYLSENRKKDNLVKLKHNNEIYFFTINSLYMNEHETLITMQNITELKHKEQLLYQQSKMASLGEMIANIAHQWRQPLSIISTGATGMLAKKEFAILTDEDFKNTCESINTNVQYLSQTIDDFRNFIQGDSKPVRFDLKNDVNEFVNIVDSSIKKHQINVILNLIEDTEIKGYPNELIQCFINIFNNSKDALIENNEIDNRYIFISQVIENETIILEFKDNAGGIPEEIINNIFEPYFTTKHKSQGTGLGLHMTYTLIVNAMKGDISVQNVVYKFNEKICNGASFKITIPIDR